MKALTALLDFFELRSLRRYPADRCWIHRRQTECYCTEVQTVGHRIDYIEAQRARPIRRLLVLAGLAMVAAWIFLHDAYDSIKFRLGGGDPVWRAEMRESMRSRRRDKHRRRPPATNAITANAIEAGEIELHSGGEITRISRAIVLQFDNVDDLRLALAATCPVQIEREASAAGGKR